VPYCTNCGEEVTTEQRYCSYCGEFVGDGKPDEHRREQAAGSGDRSETQTRRGRGSNARDRPPSRATGGTQAGDPTAADPAGEAAERYDQQPESEMLPSRGTFQTYFDGLRESVRLPAVLALLFVAWVLFNVLAALPASIGLLVFLLSAAVGLLGAGMAYVYTDYSYRDREVSTANALRQTADRALPLLGVWFIFVVAFSVGFVLFIIPGLYIGGRLLLAFPACVLDDEGTFDSLSSSWELTSGDSLKPMGFLVAMLVSIIGITVVLAIPQQIVFSALDVGVSDAQSIEEITELAADPTFVTVSAVFSGAALAVPVAAVQIAAAHMYLENRYGVRPEL
jgi:hypothetical protein